MKKRILVVDDKAEFRELVKFFLSQKYEVETAENGLHALSILQTGNLPDLIVSDLVMPEVDGKLFISQIRTSGVFNHIPVIILSSIDKSIERIELLELGADDYLIKPFSPAELGVRIKNLLKKVA